jgi:hypothetical protein
VDCCSQALHSKYWTQFNLCTSTTVRRLSRYEERQCFLCFLQQHAFKTQDSTKSSSRCCYSRLRMKATGMLHAPIALHFGDKASLLTGSSSVDPRADIGFVDMTTIRWPAGNRTDSSSLKLSSLPPYRQSFTHIITTEEFHLLGVTSCVFCKSRHFEGTYRLNYQSDFAACFSC